MGIRTKRLLAGSRPDIHTIVFAGMLSLVGLVLVGMATWVLSQKGWGGMVSLKGSTEELTLPQAFVAGGISIGLGALVLRAGWRRPS